MTRFFRKNMNDVDRTKKKGFTLIELLVVSTIIVVLSAIGLVSYANAGKGARDAKRKSDLETVRQALILYRVDNGSYPPVALITNGGDKVAQKQNFSKSSIFDKFKVPKVFAVSGGPVWTIPPDDGGSTPLPTLPPTATPLPTALPTATPTEVPHTTPTPTAEPVVDVRKTQYLSVTTDLIDDNYLEGSVPVDPKNDGTYYYGYVSDGSSFTLSATMEKRQSDNTFSYLVTN